MKVKIQNIIGIGNKGEFNSSHALASGDLPSRLLSHLKNLIAYTAKMHLKVLAEGADYELITRLTLNEFSLYTNERPLSLSEYKAIISEISAYSKMLPPNIHLVLASLPILWSDGEIHNTVLHIQSPRKKNGTPLIHHLDKKIPDRFDPKYIKDSPKYPLYRENFIDSEAYLDIYLTHEGLYQLLEKSDYYNSEHSPNLLLGDTHVRVNDINQHRGALRIKTSSGEVLLITVEICVEHNETNRLGISDTKSLIQKLTLAGKKVPSIGNHVLTSNNVEIVKENLTATVIQADPKNPPTKYRETARETLDNPIFGNSWCLFTYHPKKVKPIKQKNLERELVVFDNVGDEIDNSSAPT